MKMLMMLLGFVCLTLLSGQAVLAQDTTPNEKDAAVSRPGLTGVMTRKFVKRGSGKKIWRVDAFHDVDVKYDKRTGQWNIFTKAKANRMTMNTPGNDLYWDMWIKYNERSGLLVISTTEENRNQWILKRHPNIKVTIDENKTSLKLEFLRDFEGTNEAGYHYNWMKGTWLEATL